MYGIHHRQLLPDRCPVPLLVCHGNRPNHLWFRNWSPVCNGHSISKRISTDTCPWNDRFLLLALRHDQYSDRPAGELRNGACQWRRILAYSRWPQFAVASCSSQRPAPYDRWSGYPEDGGDDEGRCTIWEHSRGESKQSQSGRGERCRRELADWNRVDLQFVRIPKHATTSPKLLFALFSIAIIVRHRHIICIQASTSAELCFSLLFRSRWSSK